MRVCVPVYLCTTANICHFQNANFQFYCLTTMGKTNIPYSNFKQKLYYYLYSLSRFLVNK